MVFPYRMGGCLRHPQRPCRQSSRGQDRYHQARRIHEPNSSQTFPQISQRTSSRRVTELAASPVSSHVLRHPRRRSSAYGDSTLRRVTRQASQTVAHQERIHLLPLPRYRPVDDADYRQVRSHLDVLNTVMNQHVFTQLKPI